VRSGRAAAAFAAVCLLATLPPDAAQALSLREVVERVIHGNPNIGASRAERNATYYQLLQSKGRLFPEANVEAEFGAQKLANKLDEHAIGQGVWSRRRQAAFSVTQTIFDGHERHYDIAKNAARLDAASIRVLETSEALALDAIEAYLDVRRFDQLAALTRSNVSRHSEILRIVEAQFKGGRAPASDVSQIRGRLASAEAVVEANRQQALNTSARFRRVVGVEPAGLAPVPVPPGVPGSREAAIAEAASGNPGVKAALADADASAFAADQSLSDFYPTISLEGSTTYAYERDGKMRGTEDMIGSIVLRWKLFDGLIRHNRRRELVERAAKSRLEADATHLANVEIIDRAWAAYQVGRSRIAALNRQVAASDEVVDAFLEEYELSKRSLLEVVDAESLRFNAKFQLLGAEAIQRFAAYQLLAGMGRLLSSLGISPPPESQTRGQLYSAGQLDGFDVLFEPLR
jgi:adhesin transport system outer membrane protein